MKKETYYFSHDYTARSDEKIKNLIYDFGYQGYGIYWALIEELYQNANALQTNYKRIAFDMRIDEKIVKSIVENYGLFIVENEYFGSLSVQRRLDMRNEKSVKARESAQKRWTKNANALPTQSECNAIKESKVKESKRKVFIKPTIEEIKQEFPTFNADYFFNYYESNGWMVGKNKMKDWKATVKNWMSKDYNNQTQQVSLKPKLATLKDE
jgi:L-rhamnose mutarotase